jgi:hypothetical protein
MAHNRIPLSSIQLVDRWPGPVNPNFGKPTDGWDSSNAGNFKTTSGDTNAPYKLGTKIMQYSDNTHAPGWYTMMYLHYHAFESGAISRDYSDTVQWCVQSDVSTSELNDNSHAPYCVVTNEVTAGTTDWSRGALLALPCSTVTASDGTTDGTANNSYGGGYGWFWVGGVCPVLDATLFDTTQATTTGVGVEVECGSLYAGGPLTIDVSTSRIYFENGVPFCDSQHSNIPAVLSTPIVAYGGISGSA